MNLFFRNKRKLAILLSAVFLFITAVTGAAAALSGNLPEPQDISSSQDASGGEEPSSDDPSQEDELPPGGETDQSDRVSAVLSVKLPGEIIGAAAASYNKPSAMKAVYLTPGVDFYTSSRTSDENVKADIDKAVSGAKSLSLNTVIVQTKLDKLVIYKGGLFPSVQSGFDILDYIIDKARENGMYVYILYGASDIAQDGAVFQAQTPDAASIDIASRNIKEVASNYSADGIILEDYYNKQTENSYSDYLKNGSGQGFQNYMREASYSRFYALATTVRLNSRSMQVGMLADPVWENKSTDEFGSDTSASFTALSGGNADTRRFVEDKLVDFVLVKAFGSLTDKSAPFEKVISWWDKLYQLTGVHMYAAMASDKACTDAAGWSSPDQLTKQLIALKAASGFRGSAFNSLGALLENPQDSTTTLIAFLEDKIKSEHIMTKLAITKPEKTEYETYEPTVMFSGASDPNFDVMFGDEALEQDKNGYFTVSVDLKAGLNTFVFKHKTQTITYKITRRVQVLKEISPTGNITVDGGMQITLSALAYEDADVYAMINGKTVTLTEEDSKDDSYDRDSSYIRYTGVYTAPSSTSSTQNLGNIVVKAEWGGVTESKTGASVKVNKKAVIGSGKYVEISKTSAEMFPSNTLDDLSSPNCFPLPKGTLDQILGDPIIYKEGNSTFEYYMLQHGQRVYTSDVKNASSGAKLGDNAIKGLTVQSDSRYTKVILNTEQKVPYKVSYSSSGLSIKFEYTDSVPDNLNLTKNPLFKSAKWSGSTLTLAFKSGGFLGYRAYYDGDKLVFRFNNSPGGVDGARIVIDPGHGKGDPGALGFYQGQDEREINLAIAEELEDILESRGASVKRLATESSKIVLDDRIAQSRAYEPHIFISIHANSAISSDAKGSEAYYFYDFSKAYATRVSSNMASELGTTNRGSKFSRFRVTRESEFLTTLAETGFVSNKSEYTKLLNSGYQSDIASGIANAIEDILSSYSTSGSGTESVGSTGQKAVTAVKLDKAAMELAVGAKATLTATVEPSDATNKNIKWESADTSIATVSATGEVTALKAGTVKVKAISESDTSKFAECTVTVVIPVTGVTLNKASAELTVGGTEQLTATIAPETATNKNVTWSSSDANVATVDANGKVTAKAAGNAVITVKTVSGEKTAACNIKVNASTVEVTGVALNKNSAELTVGGTEQLTATVTPENATNKNVTWSSSNTAVAEVSASGLVTAKSAGSAVITVKTVSGDKTATCNVTVNPATISVTGVSLNKNELGLEISGSEQLTATVTPGNATNKNVTWESSDTAVATVDANGKVTAVGEGSAVITVRTVDGGKTATCTVTVSAPPESSEPEESSSEAAPPPESSSSSSGEESQSQA